MSDFENDVAKKIREQLENGELDNVKEELNNNSIETVDEADVEDSKLDNTNNSDSKMDLPIAKNVENSAIVDSNFTNRKDNYNKHYNRKEKIRPIALISGILAMILSVAIIAVAVFVLIKIAPPFINIIMGIIGFFFNDKVVIFTIILGWIFGLLVLLLVGMILLLLVSLLLSLCITTLQISINSFRTMRQPKQVFALDRPTFSNIVLSFVLGAIISFLGFSLFMDKNQSRIVATLFLVAGIIYLLVAILLLIDRIICKRAYRKLSDINEKQEIKEEADTRLRIERQIKNSRKRISRFFN